MNEELQKALTAMIHGMSATITSVKDVAVEQLPAVAVELLRWRLVSTVTELVIISAVVLLCIWGIRTLDKISVTDGKPDYDDTFGFMLFICIVGTFFFVGILFDLAAILQIIIAPKLYLVEYAQKMLSH